MVNIIVASEEAGSAIELGVFFTFLQCLQIHSFMEFPSVIQWQAAKETAAEESLIGLANDDAAMHIRSIFAVFTY